MSHGTVSMINHKFANMIKEIRNRQGLTQEELAKKLGCFQRTVSGWEKGHEPQSKWRNKLIEILGPDLETCFTSSSMSFQEQASPIYGSKKQELVEIPVFKSALQIKELLCMDAQQLTPKQCQMVEMDPKTLGGYRMSEVFAFVVDTNCLSPLIQAGYIVYCLKIKTITDIKDGDIVVLNQEEHSQGHIYKAHILGKERLYINNEDKTRILKDPVGIIIQSTAITYKRDEYAITTPPPR